MYDTIEGNTLCGRWVLLGNPTSATGTSAPSTAYASVSVDNSWLAGGRAVSAVQASHMVMGQKMDGKDKGKNETGIISRKLRLQLDRLPLDSASAAPPEI